MSPVHEHCPLHCVLCHPTLCYAEIWEAIIFLDRTYPDRLFEDCLTLQTDEDYYRWELGLPNRVLTIDKELIRKAWATYRNETDWFWVPWFAPWK